MVATRKNAPWAIALIAILLFAAALRFVDRAVIPYFLHYDAAQFGPYWPKRFGILGHMSLGMVALLIGPFQLWSGLRRRYPKVHRWTGRVFMVACLLSACFALYMAMAPSFGWPYGLALVGLATAWVSCALMGYFSIRRGELALHRRWMIRTYVVTFAFVTYRAFTEYLNWAGIGTTVEQEQAAAWFCWSFPLLATLAVEGVSDLRKAGRRRARV